MTAAQLREIVEDAFCAYLEDRKRNHAVLPRSFTVLLPWEAFDDPRSDGARVLVDVYVITIAFGERDQREAEWMN